LEEQPAQMNSVVTKRARNEPCRAANRGFAKIKGAPLFPADLSCGRRATRKLGSCAIRFASRLRPSVCENETSMTSIQAMRWFYRRLLDAPQMPKCLSQVPRERGSASANPFRAPSLLLRLAESIWKNSLNRDGPGSELTSGTARERLSADYSRPHTATMLGADLGM